MSTPNFKIKNASRYFVFGTAQYITQDDIDANGWDQDELGKYDEIGTEMHAEDDRTNVLYDLKAKGWDAISENDGDRSYPTYFFAEKCKNLHAGDTEIYVSMRAGSTAGYYEAATFDWDVQIRVCGYIDGYYEDFEYDFDELSKSDVMHDNWYDNAGLSAIHAQRIIAKIEKAVENLQNEAELAFSLYSDYELHCKGVFSNGEAVYGENSKRLWQEIEDAQKAA